MSEVSAEKIDRGRASDPASAARRRKMTIKLKQARQSLTSNSVDFPGQYASLARLFAHSVMSATPAMALVVIAVGATACLWVACAQGRRVGLPARRGARRALRPRRRLSRFARRRKDVRLLAAQVHRRGDFRRRLMGADRRPAAAIERPERAHLRAGRSAAGLRNDRDGRLGDPLRRRRRLGADDDRDRLRPRAGDARGSA